jgi:hypothetical protein
MPESNQICRLDAATGLHPGGVADYRQVVNPPSLPSSSTSRRRCTLVERAGLPIHVARVAQQRTNATDLPEHVAVLNHLDGRVCLGRVTSANDAS